MTQRVITALAAVVVTLVLCNWIVGATGMAPTMIELPTTITVGLAGSETATFIYDPDPEIRWTATDVPRTLQKSQHPDVHLGLIGDSEAYGYCVGRDHALDMQLVTLDPGVRVTNYAVSGYDAGQNAALALREVPRTPGLDALVWVWHWNDRTSATYNALMVERIPGSVYVDAQSWLVRESSLARLVWATTAHARATPLPPTSALLAQVHETLQLPILLVPLPLPGGAVQADLLRDASGVAGVQIVRLGAWASALDVWCEDRAHLNVMGKQKMARDILRAVRQSA